MKRLYVCDGVHVARQLAELLRGEHIDCMIKNEFLSGAIGDLPPTECWPEVWIVNDFQLEKAQALLTAFTEADRDAARGEPWTCRCGEQHAAQFSACWRCGFERAPYESINASPTPEDPPR